VANLTGSVGLTRERLFIDEDAIEPPGVIEHIDDRSWVLGLGSRCRSPFTTRTRATSSGREVSSKEEVEVLLAELRERLLALLKDNVRVRLE